MDLALASRVFPDSTVLWVLGAAPHWGDLDPLPRHITLDDTLALQANVPETMDLLLYVATPDGPVNRFHMTPGVARWVDLFHVPGEYRLEVVQTNAQAGRVLFQFSVFVESRPAEPAALPAGYQTQDPILATGLLYQALNDRRRRAGLGELGVFHPFEALAREHSAFMASSAVLDHRIPGVTEGVAARAWQLFHPAAEHTEDLAVAYSWQDAMHLVWASAGHRANLLCGDCTHVAIGVALEPVETEPARLYVTWEMLSFPQGEPRPITRPR